MTTYLGKSCSFCLPRVSFVNCRQFMYLVFSLLVLRAGYGIWLYQFLIIAYRFTFLTSMFVLGCLPPYEHVCVCLSVRAYVPECIVCACAACYRSCVCMCVCVGAFVWVRPSVRFDRTSLRSSMHAFVCLHARVHEGVCLSPSVRLSVRVHVRASKCLFAHACVHQCMRGISYF